jgi:hypothetical protein
MNKTRTLTAIALAAALAAGCGTTAAGGTPPAPRPPAASTVAQAPTIASVAQARGLTVNSMITPPTLYASAEATCTTAGGRQIDLATFATNEQRDNWVKIAAEFGALVFQGDRYAAVS